MAVTKRRFGTRGEEWSSERGSLRVERPAPNIVIYRGQGHLQAELAELFVQSVNDALENGTKPHLFWDGEGMTGYDSQVRIRIGEHCMAVKHEVAAMNVYTPNRFVAMGAAVINVWLGGFFNIVRTRAELDDLIYDARLAGFSRS